MRKMQVQKIRINTRSREAWAQRKSVNFWLVGVLMLNLVRIWMRQRCWKKTTPAPNPINSRFVIHLKILKAITCFQENHSFSRRTNPIYCTINSVFERLPKTILQN